MADPLHNDDGRNYVRHGELNRGSRVAYDAPLEGSVRRADMSADHELPDPKGKYRDHQLKESNLLRVAEQIGGALGTTVSQARRVPGSARHGIHLVSDRAQEMATAAVGQISTSASSLADSAQQGAQILANRARFRLREFTEMAHQLGVELMDVAEERGRLFFEKAEGMGQQLRDRTSEIKHELDERTREMRARARMQVEDAKFRAERVVRERPLQVVGGIAAAAFILGVSLRIVRSRHARGC